MTRQDLGQMFLLSAFWGVSFLLIKFSGEVFPPLWISFLRSLFGLAVLLVALRLGGHRLPPWTNWKVLLIVAFFNNALPWSLFAVGELTVSSNIAAILNATTPLFTLLLAFVWREGEWSRRVLSGVCLGLLGVILTVFSGISGGHATLWGVLSILLASFGYGLATNIAKRTLSGFHPVGLATAQLGLSMLMLAPLALSGPWPQLLTTKALLSALFLGVFGSGLAYLLYYGLLARISGTQVSAVTYILPIWGLFWGFLAGEALGWLSLVGVAVILAGLLLINWKPRGRLAAGADG